MGPAQRHRLEFHLCAELVWVPAKDLMANTYFSRIIWYCDTEIASNWWTDCEAESAILWGHEGRYTCHLAPDKDVLYEPVHLIANNMYLSPNFDSPVSDRSVLVRISSWRCNGCCCFFVSLFILFYFDEDKVDEGHSSSGNYGSDSYRDVSSDDIEWFAVPIPSTNFICCNSNELITERGLCVNGIGRTFHNYPRSLLPNRPKD